MLCYKLILGGKGRNKDTSFQIIKLFQVENEILEQGTDDEG